MNIYELISARKSVRDFLPEPIPEDILNNIMEAGRLAPSAQNRQPWRYLIYTDPNRIQQIAKHCGLIGLSNFFIKKAPCLVVACADTKSNIRINNQDYYLVDTAISLHQMVLTAWEYGIGSCWLAAFSEKKLRAYLDLPKSWKVVALCPFGYPADKSMYSKMLSGFAGSHDRLARNKIYTMNKE